MALILSLVDTSQKNQSSSFGRRVKKIVSTAGECVAITCV